MRIPTRGKTWCAVATACLFFLQSCAAIVRGTSQKIPVTSNPVGARIIVDGRDMGVTPLSLKLAKKKDHIIRIEKEGYIPVEIKALSRGASGRTLFVLGNIIWGLLAALPGVYLGWGGLLGTIFGSEEAEETMETGALLALLGLVAGWLGAVRLDSSLGATRSLQPEEVSITLRTVEERTPYDVLVLTLEDWQNIKWIRIAIAGANNDAGTIFIN